MRSGICRKIGSLLTACGVILWLLAGICFTAYAEDSADGSLQLICKSEDTVIEGMTWKLFYAGSRDGDSFKVGGDFKDYKLSLKNTSADAMTDAASTFETYVIIDRIKPMTTGVTDDRGVVDFTGLKQGLYLVCGKTTKIDHTSYVPIPFFVEIAQEEDGSNQNYVSYPKFFHFSVLDERDADYTVRKLWKNEENQPPNEDITITVELYKDGEYDSTVVLDKSNDWSYTWTAHAHTDFRVKEIDIPDDYTVVYRSNETQYVIVNTLKGFEVLDEGEQPTTSPSTDTPELTTTTTGDASSGEITVTTAETTGTPQISIKAGSDTPATPVTYVKKNTPSSNVTVTAVAEKLPQTGQLWWPVPVLLVAGIVFISIGCRLRSRK